VGAELPLVARRTDLAVLTGAIAAATCGRGQAVLLTGEAGVGKTRLLVEAQREAERSGVLVLKGRAVESGGAYRPLVEAFARVSAPYADRKELASVRPILARVLPGWTSDQDVLAPMADPAAVLAEALLLLLQAMAADGSVLLIDDLHWADEDTISVLSYVADSMDQLPLALLLAARTEPPLPDRLERLSTPAVRQLPLSRLTPAKVRDALRAQELPGLAAETVDQLVTAVDGLPLVLDEFVRQLRESPAHAIDMKHTTLAAAVQRRLRSLPREARVVLDTLSVLSETDAKLLAAVTGLDDPALSTAIHDAVASTLLVTAATPLGISWRHPLMRDAVRDLLLPLEQQALARRAADHLVNSTTEPSEGQLRQAAELYQLAGYQDPAARLWVRAARAAVRKAALDVAEKHLAAAHALTGTMPEAAQEVLIERIETLTLAGRAHDAYDSGVAALQRLSGHDAGPLLVATARAAYGADLHAEAAALLDRLEQVAEPTEVDLAVLGAHAALAERRIEAIALGQRAAALAQEHGRFDLACEVLLIVGYASRRHGTDMRGLALNQALSLSKEHQLSVWQVRALTELGRVDFDADSDPSRFYEARERATAAGMVGMVAAIDLHIAETIDMRSGPVAAYPTFLAADTQARQLKLMGLHAHTRVHIAECLLNADDRPLPGRARPAAPSEVDDVIAEALALGEKSKPFPWAKVFLGMRAWLRGDSISAMELFDESLRYPAEEVHVAPFWGIGPLLRVVAGADTEEAFGPIELTGHHVNWAARGFATAVSDVRGGRSAAESIAEAEYYVRHTPYMRHLLHTMIAPTLYSIGVEAALGWLREAEAFCSAAGERALQRRIRNELRSIGAKVPRDSTSAVPPHLARFGITARELEILRLVNAGLSNADISHRLFISTRTVESHVSSMLQKTGRATREQLPSADRAKN
jgi:DNA-binding CsgD family transcriptional regulator/tetratricopeptide (TPR) repeat protein